MCARGHLNVNVNECVLSSTTELYMAEGGDLSAFSDYNNSKKDSKDQDSIQSSTTPFPGYQIRK